MKTSRYITKAGASPSHVERRSHGLFAGKKAPQFSLLAAPLLAWALTLAATVALAQGGQADRYAASTTITLGDEAVVSGSGASASGSRVTITEAGTYLLTGSTADGSVEVRAPGAAVTLVLDGAHIVNGQGPAILFAEAQSATVTLADGSLNSLADGGASEFDAALYSAASLIINGSGSLDVRAVYEGISSTMHIYFEGGAVRIWSAEDGVNANNDGVSQINVTGGYLYVQTEAGDGIDSNGTIAISGGTVVTQGALVDANSGLDADGGVTITGGSVIATGGRMMGSVTSGAAQGTLLVNYASTQGAGTLVVIRNAAGTELLAFAPAIAYQQLIVSSPEILAGVEYTVYAGGTPSGQAVDGWYAERATYPGTVVVNADTESAQDSGRFGPGNRPGGAPGRP